MLCPTGSWFLKNIFFLADSDKATSAAEKLKINWSQAAPDLICLNKLRVDNTAIRILVHGKVFSS